MNLKDRLTPVDVRKLMLGEHHNIRTKLDELSRSAKTLLTAGPNGLARVLRLTRHLARDLKAQIALETAILVPTLRTVDAWGEVRANKLLVQLRKRRRKLRALRRSAAQNDHVTLGGQIDQYIDERRSGHGARGTRLAESQRAARRPHWDRRQRRMSPR